MSLPTKEELLAQLLPDPKPQCPVCRDEMEEFTSTPCNHTFHLHCLASWMEKSNTCPLCRTKLYREALEPYYFRDSQEPLTINDISPHPHVWAANWADNRNIVLRNHRNNVLNHINKFRALQQSTSTGPERAFIGLDHDILDRLVAAYCWSRPNSVNNLSNADRCLTQWWLVFTAFLEVIDRLRGICVTSGTLSELLSKKVEFALSGRYPNYCEALAQRPSATTFKDDVEIFVALFVKMAQDAYEEKVGAEGLGTGPGAFTTT